MIRSIFPVTVAVFAILLTALLFALPVPTGADATGQESSAAALPDAIRAASEFIIADVDIIANGELVSTQSVHIKDGRIAAIGTNPVAAADIPTFDANGLTAIPGLIDSHTHSYGTALEDAVRFGVTAQLDMFSAPAMLPETRAGRASIEATTKTDLFSAGMIATADGGHGTQYGVPIQTLSGPQDAPEWVAARKAEGSDFIKLVYMPGQERIPSIDRNTAKAIIDAAHANKMLAVAHISTQAAALDLIHDGVDGLVHIFADSVATPEFITAAVDSEVFVIPTLVIVASVDGKDVSQQLIEDDTVSSWLSTEQHQTLSMQFGQSIPGFSLETALTNTGLLHEAGVPILAGSDAPNPGTAHGASVHQEMALLVQAGMSNAAALASATTLPAKLFSLSQRAELKSGHRADLVLIQDNPLENINATRDILYVLKNGHFIERATGVGLTSEPFEGNLLGSFDAGETLHGAFEWAPTTDEMAGGKSQAAISLTQSDVADGSHAIAVSGDVKAGFAYPWAGAAVTPATGQNSKDVSRFGSISFAVKGTPGAYRAMVFSGTGAGIPPMQNFSVNSDWQTITLGLKDFPGFDAKNFAGFGFVAGPATGHFEIVLDSIQFED